LILPFTVAGVKDEAAKEARSSAFRLCIEHLGQSEYFSISVWPSHNDFKLSMADTITMVQRSAARYGMVGQIVSKDGDKAFFLNIFRAIDNRVLWSESTPLPHDTGSDEFWLEIQRIVNRTIQIISHDELQRASSGGEESLDAIGLTWTIRSLLYSSNQHVFERARKYIDFYLAKYPHDPEAIIQDSFYEIIHHLKFSDAPADEFALRQLAKRAIEANPTDVRGPAAAAFVDMMTGRIDLAIVHAETAVAMIPGYIEAHSQLAQLYLLDGRLEKARASLRRAEDLCPNPWRHSYTLSYLALYHALAGNPEKAIEYSNQALAVVPDEALPILVKVHCLTQLDRIDEAEQVLLVQGPVVWHRIGKELKNLRFSDPAVTKAFRASLELAGLRADHMFGSPAPPSSSLAAP
jgi:tetratricopeptide (TPR) repeat protein